MRRTSALLSASICAVLVPLAGTSVAGTSVAGTSEDATDANGRVRHAPAAPKAGVKPWVTVATPNLGIWMPDVLRVGKQLHVIWSRQDGGVHSVRTRILNAKGRIASPTKPVVTGWVSTIGDPKLLKVGGDLLAVFAGIRSFAPSDPYVGPAVYASSPNGLNWTLEPGSLSQTTAAGNAETIDVINSSGQAMFGMGGFNSHVIMHRGINASSPASTSDFFSSTLACCSPVSVSLANDRGTNHIWVSWFSLGATDPGQAGTFAQQVWPRPNGQLRHAPGSANAMGQATAPGQPVAMAERAGGDIWLAYPKGYPTSRTIRLWKVGTNTFWDVKTGTQVANVGLTAGTGGRLWLAWWALGDRTIRAARTNPQVTRLGAVRITPEPGGLSGQINRFVLEGSAGPLDVVAAAQPPGSGSSGVYALHVLPGLSVKVAPKRLDKGRVTVTVTDAGQAVRAARVTLRGHAVRTNAHGKAVFQIGRAVPDGRYPATVAKAGYAKATARVQVT